MRQLLGWERYDSGAAVEAVDDLYRQELRLWMNLYLPSVKLVKKVRVGSKVRRVYDAAQTPMERVLTGAQAKPERVAELKKLRQSLDPFQLGKLIDQKLQRIYDLANRRLSPKFTAENRAAQAKEKTPRGRAKRLWKSRSVEKSKKRLFHRAWKSRKERAIPTFPQPRPRWVFGYISNVSTVEPRVTSLNGLTRGDWRVGKHLNGCTVLGALDVHPMLRPRESASATMGCKPENC